MCQTCRLISSHSILAVSLAEIEDFAQSRGPRHPASMLGEHEKGEVLSRSSFHIPKERHHLRCIAEGFQAFSQKLERGTEVRDLIARYPTK